MATEKVYVGYPVLAHESCISGEPYASRVYWSSPMDVTRVQHWLEQNADPHLRRCDMCGQPIQEQSSAS